MPTAAKSAFGTSLTWNSQTVAELTNIGGVEITVDMIDATSHQSADGFREFIASLANGGEVAIEGNFVYTDTNGQLAMVTDAAAKTSRTAVITFPSSIATWTFTAAVSKIKVGDNAPDGKIPFTASLKISGKPTLATSASANATNIVVTTATLYPTFAAATYEYVAVSAGNSCTVTVTFSAGVCTVSANGQDQEVLTGVASSSISLGGDGTRTEITITIQETGKTPKKYTLDVANTV